MKRRTCPDPAQRVPGAFHAWNGRPVEWPGKPELTFSDAITAVRPWLWVEWVFASPGEREAFEKLCGGLRRILLNGLAPTA